MLCYFIQKFVFLTSPLITFLLKNKFKTLQRCSHLSLLPSLSHVWLKFSMPSYIIRYTGNSNCLFTCNFVSNFSTISSQFPFLVHYHYSSVTNANQNVLPPVLDYYITGRIQSSQSKILLLNRNTIGLLPSCFSLKDYSDIIPLKYIN